MLVPIYGNDFRQEKTLRLQAANSHVIRHDHNANSPYPNILLFMIA